MIVAVAAEHRQLELNAMTPVITHNLLFPMHILSTAVDTLAKRCIGGLEANEKMCEYWLERPGGARQCGRWLIARFGGPFGLGNLSARSVSHRLDVCV